MHAPHIQTKLPGPKAKKIMARDHQVLSPSLTRPYPFVMQSGEGVTVTDVDGNTFLDFTSGIAVCSTGHSHPEVIEAIQKQARQFLHMCGSDFYYENQILLAEKLAASAPGKFRKRVFFTNSGTETVEAALKLSRYATGRKKLLAFYGAFHGRTMGSLSLTNSKAVQRKNFGPFLPDVFHAPYGDIHFLEKTLFKRLLDPTELAAVIVEPIQGEGGYVLPPKDFLPQLRALATKHGFLFVADEIQTGMGRTGKMFAVEHFNVVPDLICLAKGIASGLPLGALIAKESLMQWAPGAQGSTFGGNPVACAAALATLNLIEKKYMANAQRQGAVLKSALEKSQKSFSLISEVRGKGLMLAIEIGDSKKREAILTACFEKGLLLLGCGESAIRIIPPLCVTEPEIKIAVDLLNEVLKKIG